MMSLSLLEPHEDSFACVAARSLVLLRLWMRAAICACLSSSSLKCFSWPSLAAMAVSCCWQTTSSVDTYSKYFISH